MPDLEVVALLCAAALLAGWIDAVAGGGGLIQLPALLILMPGATPAQVLATNKLSSVFVTAVAASVYIRRVRPDLRTALPMAAVALAGSAAGAACASLLPESTFRPLVLVLLVLVGAYTLKRPALGDVQKLRFGGGRHLAAALAAAVTIGFYDGIFGPGTGSFLVFALVALMGYSFVQASAKARIVNLATNLGRPGGVRAAGGADLRARARHGGVQRARGTPRRRHRHLARKRVRARGLPRRGRRPRSAPGDGCPAGNLGSQPRARRRARRATTSGGRHASGGRRRPTSRARAAKSSRPRRSRRADRQSG